MEWDSGNSTKSPLLTQGNAQSLRGWPYALLFLTIGLETFGTLMLKHSLEDGRIYIIAFACYFTSLGLFSVVLKYIPLSIAYTTWCTLGTVGVCVMSALFFGETLRPSKWACVVLTIPCVVGLYVL